MVPLNYAKARGKLHINVLYLQEVLPVNLPFGVGDLFFKDDNPNRRAETSTCQSLAEDTPNTQAGLPRISSVNGRDHLTRFSAI